MDIGTLTPRDFSAQTNLRMTVLDWKELRVVVDVDCGKLVDI
ncbi:MAG: hypothetical protein ACP5J4_17910 [Anaerolineae bacterium]